MLNLGSKVLHRKKKIFVVSFILISLAASLTLSGCNINNRINAPLNIKYTVKNPIIIEEHTSGDGNQFTYTYLTIEGLIDKEIQQKINDKIKVVYEEALVQDLPPYRGIRKYVPDRSEIVQENIYMTPSGNINNILSIMVNKYITYAVPNQDGVITKYEKDYYDNSRYIAEVICLNIDLNTGEEITLKDIFCDNVDYMTILNDYMSDFLSTNYADEEGYYYTMSGDLKLVESFKGLSEDQKFALYPFGVSLIFDYDTPQFDTRFMASTPFINFRDLGDNLALTKRFYDDTKNIYESQESSIKSLLQGYQHSDVVGYDHKQEGKINFYNNWSYSSDLPQKIQDDIQKLKPNYSEVAAELNKELESIPDSDINEFSMIGYECYIYADTITDYINVMKSSFISMPNRYKQMIEYHCYDKNSLEELELNDLFKDDYDYKPTIIEFINKTLKERDTNSGTSSVVEFSKEDIEDMYHNIKGFSLTPDEIYIPVAELSSEGSTYSMSIIIPYAEFGCENMTIFDNKKYSITYESI